MYLSFDNKIYQLWKYEPKRGNPGDPKHSFYYDTVELARWDKETFELLYPKLADTIVRPVRVCYYRKKLTANVIVKVWSCRQ